MIEAIGKIDQKEIVPVSLPFENHPGHPFSIVNYTVRTKKKLLLNNAFQEGNFTNDPYVVKHRSKSVLCMPVLHQGKPTGALYLENDLVTGVFTEDRLETLGMLTAQVAISIENARLYEDLEQKNIRLVELDKLKDEFLANTSHELRTPLQGIIGISRSLIDGADGALPDAAYHDLCLIEKSGRRLANLVDDILDFSRLENRDLELKKKPMDIRSVTDTVMDLSTILKGNKDVTLVNTIPSDTPIVDADENRVHQILFNLIGNSVKFTDQREVTVSATWDRHMARITVTDTGIGIKGSRLSDIFEPFEQADGSISREYGGTGIGLSIVRQLVELHGGSVQVESEFGKGSAFTFSLPVSKDEKAAKPAISLLPVRDAHGSLMTFDENRKRTGEQGRILVIDDDPVNLRVIRNYLYNENYTVSLFENGADALDSIREKREVAQRYDLALLDIMMPKISGYEVCREIRKLFSSFELPVIMLTARSRVSDLVAGLAAGANDYLVKPVNREEMIARVKNLVTLRKKVSEHREARFRLLQDRMNPHFLFNALNTIHALIWTDQVIADEAVLKVADNYRFLVD
ncbi:MAG: response regulator, partial [bacterium]|nr:response regulator [bacterium]